MVSMVSTAYYIFSQISAMLVLQIIFMLVCLYLLIGIVFAIPFVLKGVERVDEGAAGSGWGFKGIIVPGVIIFWPILLRKWIDANNAEKG